MNLNHARLPIPPPRQEKEIYKNFILINNNEVNK